jgi:hypothetical protein
VSDARDGDEDRTAILRRRAIFVATAIAGLGAGPSCGDPQPRACLDISTTVPTESAELPPPQPCLDVPPPHTPPQPCLEVARPEDAGVAAPQDAGAARDAGRDAGPPPRPCLKKAPPPPPQPCLDMPAPRACLDVDSGSGQSGPRGG